VRKAVVGPNVRRRPALSRAYRSPLLVLFGAITVWSFVLPPSANALEGSTHDDTVGGVTDAVDDTVGGVTDAVDDTGGGVTDAVDDTVGGVTDAVDDTGGGVTDAVDDTVGGVTDAVDDTVGGVTDAVDDTVGGVVDGTTDNVGGTIDDAIGTETPTPGSSGGGSIVGPGARDATGVPTGHAAAASLGGSPSWYEVWLAQKAGSPATAAIAWSPPRTEGSGSASTPRPRDVITGGSSNPFAAVLLAVLLIAAIAASWQRRGHGSRSSSRRLGPFVVEPPD
jgi:hypothetical protein